MPGGGYGGVLLAVVGLWVGFWAIFLFVCVARRDIAAAEAARAAEAERHEDEVPSLR